MDRRGFLTTTFAGGLAATGSACASTAGVRGGQTSELPLGDDELERKLVRLDKTLARMNHKRTTEWFHEQRRAAGAPALTEADRERLTHEGELVRASMRSALLVSSVAELPEGNRTDPRVVARIEQIAGEADYAVHGTLAKLRNLSASDLAALDSEFAGASPGMDVAERVDELSEQLGVSASRRLHLRRMAKHLDWQLERERFSTVVADVIDKVGKTLEAAAQALDGTAEAAMAGPDLNWVERTREVVRFYAPADGQGAPAPMQPIGQPSAAQPQAQPQPQPQPQGELPTYSQADMAAWEAEQQRYREIQAAQRDKLEKKRLRGVILAGTGGGLMVLGGVAVGVSVPFVGVAVGAIIAASLGGVAITAGIILLIIGLVLAVRAKRQLAGNG